MLWPNFGILFSLMLKIHIKMLVRYRNTSQVLGRGWYKFDLDNDIF